MIEPIRILKDIRYYESNDANSEKPEYPSPLGKIITPTNDAIYIGQRIARKLNELNFYYYEFDHLYINLTTALNENEVEISNRDLDKRIKYINYGINNFVFNALGNSDKNELIKKITFNVLKSISKEENLDKVIQVEQLILASNTEIEIKYKTKETKLYKVDISYQIGFENVGTRAIILFNDKEKGFCKKGYYPLYFYDDIYSLIDTIALADNTIKLLPKKSFRADICNKRYATPIELKVQELENISCH